jgi:hypothetical protein
MGNTIRKNNEITITRTKRITITITIMMMKRCGHTV